MTEAFFFAPFDTLAEYLRCLAMLARIQQLIVFLIVVDRPRRRGDRVQARSARVGAGGAAAHRRRLRGGPRPRVLLASRLVRRGVARPADDRASCFRRGAIEVLIAPRVFLWRQPFRSAAIADSVPADARGRRGVVLVHGFFCNRGLWNPWMQRLREKGVPFVAADPRAGVRLDRPLSRHDRSGGRPARSRDRNGAGPGRPQHGRAGDPCLARARRPGRGALSSRRHHRHAASRHLDRAPRPHPQRHRDAHRQSLARGPGPGRRRTEPTTGSPASGVTATTSSFRPAVRPCPEPTTGTFAQTPHVAMAFHPDVFAYVLQSLHAR